MADFVHCVTFCHVVNMLDEALTRGAWIHACDTTVQYRFVSHCCDVILLCIVSQISNKIKYCILPSDSLLRTEHVQTVHELLVMLGLQLAPSNRG